jgi:enoyl-[acyl-carrier protein] reductase I
MRMATDRKKKVGLIVGVANEHSIAWGCAQSLRREGAEIALTYLNDKAKGFVEPLAKQIEAPILMPLDVTNPQQQDALFRTIKEKWGRLDFLLHSIAFAPKADLQAGVSGSSREGFLTALDISCHSLIRLTQAALPLMSEGGSVLTMSYYGARKAVPNYGLMGPVKAALETTMRYLASELGPKRIRVNAISPGPIKTRAASGLSHFDELMEQTAAAAPLHQLVTIEDVGDAAAFLVSDHAQSISGQVIYVDAGFNAIVPLLTQRA